MDYPELVRLRKELHQHPELSGQEKWTSARIISELQIFNPDQLMENLGGFGLAAIFIPENGRFDKTILFRAELDALPLHESSDLPHSSKNSGVMHACGHDGHMAILLGLAKKIRKKTFSDKRYILLFQPSEETGRGAGQLLHDDRFKDLRIDCGYALHNLPGFRENSVYIKYGTFACASAGFEIVFKGKASHAAYPEQGVNPALTVAGFIREISHELSHFFEDDSNGKHTFTFIKMGEPAFGMSPGEAKVGITVRASTDEKLKEAFKLTESAVSQSGKHFKGTITLSRKEPFTAVINHQDGVDKVKKATQELGLQIEELTDPLPWSEDFGEFGKKFPVTLFGIGAGMNGSPLHSETYDFNDRLIETGIHIFEKIMELE